MKRFSWAPLLAALVAGGVSLAATAEVPEWTTLELEARSNLIVNDNGWNVPPGTSFNSISAAVNDAGQVAFTASVVPIGGDLDHTGAGLWIGADGAGEFVVIHAHPPGDQILIDSAPSLNASGAAAYYTSGGFGSVTLHHYDPVSDSGTPVSTLPVTPTSIANTTLLDDGRFGFKGGLSGGYGLVMVGDAGGTLYATDENVSPGGYAYIYSPATNNAGEMAVKLSTSDYNHNEIRLFDAPGSSVLVVADQATDAGSPFAGFDNGLALNDAGAVAVVVKLADGNVRAVYRFTPDGNGYVAEEIARIDATGPVREIDFFAPAINNDGLVVFRGEDADGQAIFASDGTTLARVAGKGDVVATDLGSGQLGQHDSSPIFSGAPAVNNRGEVAFIAGLHPEGDNQVEWGSGVFLARVAADDDDGDVIFRDGFDEAFPVVEYALDDGDGNTNQGPPSTFDPDMLWGNYFLVQPGGEVIHEIAVAFGPNFPSLANGPVTFWLLEDADADGDPRNAVALAQVQATPDVFNDDFFRVAIPPTEVQGAFFVGASAQLLGGQDRPARVDTDNSGADSWFFYDPDIAGTIDDLASAAYSQTNDQTPVFPGAFMVRAIGTPADAP